MENSWNLKMAALRFKELALRNLGLINYVKIHLKMFCVIVPHVKEV